MILDGWGLGTNPEVSAIDNANTPFIDSLYNKYSWSKLQASGEAVGLPDGQMGNSEVGHMNIGAGRVVYQNLVKIAISSLFNKLNKDSLPPLQSHKISANLIPIDDTAVPSAKLIKAFVVIFFFKVSELMYY